MRPGPARRGRLHGDRAPVTRGAGNQAAQQQCEERPGQPSAAPLTRVRNSGSSRTRRPRSALTWLRGKAVFDDPGWSPNPPRSAFSYRDPPPGSRNRTLVWGPKLVPPPSGRSPHQPCSPPSDPLEASPGPLAPPLPVAKIPPPGPCPVSVPSPTVLKAAAHLVIFSGCLLWALS